MSFCDRLDPDALPYSRNSRVPYSLRVLYLLSARLEIIVGSVKHPDSEFVLTILNVRCNIKREVGVTASVSADLHIIDIHISLPVNRLKVEHQPLAFPG